MKAKKLFLAAALAAFLLSIAFVSNLHGVSGYTPQAGDFFKYSESITVNNGQGVYAGYTDQTQTNGNEQMNAANSSLVTSSYSYSYQYSNNQGSSTTSSSSGTFTWSPSNYTYVNGTDNQVGYSKPIRVWFAMNSSLPVGGSFYVLNTPFTVMSKNYSFELPTEGNKYVQTIEAVGSGQYQRNDSYGVFAASYTWHEYFDPTTGYIVGYNYVEQDNGNYQGQAGSFTYTDNLYVTQTSYPLATASTPPNSGTTSINAAGLLGLAPVIGLLVVALVVIFIIVAAVVVEMSRRRTRSLPKHSHPSYTPPPQFQQVDLGSKPPEQVVIREVAMMACKYCGAQIPTTAATCPYCGAPQH